LPPTQWSYCFLPHCTAYIFYGWSRTWQFEANNCLKCRADLKLRGTHSVPTGRGLQLINWPQFARTCAEKLAWENGNGNSLCRFVGQQQWCCGSGCCRSSAYCCCRHMLWHNLCSRPQKCLCTFPLFIYFLMFSRVFAVAAGFIWQH